MNERRRPIKVTFTAMELSAAHLAADLVVRSLNGSARPELRRAVEAMKDELERNGCVLDDDGWRTS